jgi:hypothetical protein
MQQRSGTDRRRGAERDAAQAMGGQPRGAQEDDLQDPNQVRSPLTAREFEHPRRRAEDKVAPEAGERHAAASSAGSKGEPVITNDEPARGRRGMPESRTHKLEDE